MNDEQTSSEPGAPQPRGKAKLKTWLKRLGFWGVVFFLLKGLLWLTIPALIALFTD